MPHPAISNTPTGVGELLASLRADGVEVAIDRDKVRIAAPTGVVSEHILKQLSERKTELIAYLTQPSLERRPRGQHISPVSASQRRLWFVDQLGAGKLYNMRAAFRLRGQLDRHSLVKTVQEIVRRHETLRTTFQMVDGEPVQVIAPKLEIDVGVRDISDFAAATPQQAVAMGAEAHTGWEFDLAHGPLLRCTLLRISDVEHIALFDLHHIIADGWSVSVLMREAGQIYPAILAGLACPLPELAVQYADFAQWQRQWLASERMSDQLNYWMAQLSDAPALLELPIDRPRPAVQTHCGALFEAIIDPPLAAALGQLGRQHRSTLFMVFAAALNVLLYRYSGQADICLGTPIANRNRSEFEPLIGFFLNTLVLRTRLDPRLSFAALLEQVRNTALDAYAHQDVPFEHIIEALRPARHLSHSPLFQVMLVLQNTPSAELVLPELAISEVQLPHTQCKFDLTVNVKPDQDQLLVQFEYSTALFDAETVERMASHLFAVLSAAVASPALPLNVLPLLSERELHRMLVEFNATKADYRTDILVHELIREQALARPDATALICGQQRLSYRELERHSEDLARELTGRGAGPDCLIGIYLERSIDMVVAVLATLKAACAYIPLDPSYPHDRLRFIVDDAKPALLLAKPGAEGIFGGIQIVHPMGRATDEQLELPVVESVQLAYVIYTSGSTGTPKGVAVTHGNLLNFILAMRASLPLDRSDKVLCLTSLSFDIAGLELFLPLCFGAGIVLATRDDAADPGRLWQLIREQRITLAQATPATWRLLLDYGWEAQASLKVLCGGEALPSALATQLLDHSESVWNMYGPTETTIWSAMRRMHPGQPQNLIGTPIGNTQIYILDPERRPVPLGVTGEIYIGGSGVARGYLNRPELTAERFLPDPFSGQPAARLYQTGDLGRYLPSGDIQFLGRNDFQVKIRGYRIEPGEIEARLAACPGVAQALVLAREDVPGDARLVAYLVAQDGHPLKPAALREALLAQLPDYMVPAAFVTLEAYPLTPNGKINRLALRAPDVLALAVRVYQEPEGEHERAVAVLWQQLLQLEQVGRHDDFFGLGGHSLLAVQLVTRLRERFGIDLPLRSVFELPTVAGHAAQLACALQKKVADAKQRDAVRESALRAQLQTMSRDEIAALLAAKRRGMQVQSGEH